MLHLYRISRLWDYASMNTASSSFPVAPLDTRRGGRTLWQRVNDFLDRFWKLSGRVSSPATTLCAENLVMGRGDVRVLPKCYASGHITVTRGVIWLTGTPGDGDVILREGETHASSNRWPHVIQAMEDAEVVLQ